MKPEIWEIIGLFIGLSGIIFTVTKYRGMRPDCKEKFFDSNQKMNEKNNETNEKLRDAHNETQHMYSKFTDNLNMLIERDARIQTMVESLLKNSEKNTVIFETTVEKLYVRMNQNEILFAQHKESDSNFQGRISEKINNLENGKK